MSCAIFWGALGVKMLSDTTQQLGEGLPLKTSTFKTPYSDQFTLSTQLITLNHPVILSHPHSTTVSLET